MNKQVNKILIIAPCLTMGGIERASSNTANGLSELGAKVYFLSLFKKEAFFKLNEGIEIIEPQGFNKTKLSLFKSILWIRKEVKRVNPEHILVFNKFYGAITALALLGTKYPYFLSERSSPLFVWRQPMRAINKLAFSIKPPKGVIAQTNIAAEYQRKYFNKTEVIVIPNSVREVQLFPEIKREKVILAVGRLNDYLKGFDLLIESFAKLKNQDWELHIAGGDEEGEALKEQAERLGVINRIKFLGKVKEIDKCYAYAGMFVIPSRSEGFPNALAEAMTAGCCCIAFDFVAGPNEMITNGVDGILVPSGDTQKLAEAIDDLIVKDDFRDVLAQKAIKTSQHFKKSTIISKIANVINKK
ncbi:glycosyltransferase [Flavobacterium sp.]|jgi:GalNAc-alpha-(1->4)-GalNAc-alpha-(1->3)-diNAcBac-PP-undecaprenol alpha-1,4-N-acetyl-D-galactosaminyltransferase|uniref:glycosyltransferase n=1 Tax=Flavobacterium sp. TaxID=239 RepID=UPI0037C138A4